MYDEGPLRHFRRTKREMPERDSPWGRTWEMLHDFKEFVDGRRICGSERALGAVGCFHHLLVPS